jgi:molybdate transport system ATP-binding protein
MTKLTGSFSFTYERSDEQFAFQDMQIHAAVTGIFGASGSGKSTFLRCLVGLNHITSGEIYLNETLISSPGKSAGSSFRNMSYLSQATYLFPHLTVNQNICYSNSKAFGGAYKDHIIGLLNASDLMHLFPSQLSGGQKRIIAIIRALLAPHIILILDEPMAGIDKLTAQIISRLLKEHAKKHNVMIIYVSHDIHEISSITDEIIVISNHTIVSSRPTKETLLDTQFSIDHLKEPISMLSKPNRVDVTDSNISFYFNGLIITTTADIDSSDGSHLLINSSDVAIALNKIDNSSISNQFIAIIDSIIDYPKYNAVLITLDVHGNKIQSLITKTSMSSLNIKENKQVWCLIKALSLI